MRDGKTDGCGYCIVGAAAVEYCDRAARNREVCSGEIFISRVSSRWTSWPEGRTPTRKAKK